jgi:hypothetical protein
MNTVADLFHKFGGPAQVARAIGKRQSTASEMKRRASIPIEHWQALIESEMGQEIGLSAEVLMRLNMRAEIAA